jgi:MraZ protein
MRDRDIVEPDAKVGRISISRQLLDAIGVNKEVVFSGNDFKIEIWAKEKWEDSRIANEEFIAIAESLSKK